MPLSVEHKDLSGLTVIVTGSNVGIGLETARMLSEMGAHITLACRNAQKAETAAEDIEKTTGRKPEVASLDLCTFQSTAAFVEDFKAKHQRLDILVNNAGFVSIGKGEAGMTSDGFEIDIQVNHLSQFLLTNRLLPLIKTAAQNKINDFTPRIVTVGSAAAKIGKVDFTYWEDKDKLPFFFSRYADSKLVNAMFIKKLSEMVENDGIVAHIVHPGFVNSDIFAKTDNNVPRFIINILSSIINLVARDATQGAMTSVHCAVSDNAAKTTGKYWESCRVASYPNRLMTDQEAIDRMWSESTRIIKEQGYEI